MKRVLAYAATLCYAVGVLAQEKVMPSVNDAYRKYLLLEIDMGTDINLTHQSNANLLEAFSHQKETAFSFGMQLTHFVSRHWGWHANLQVHGNSQKTGKAFDNHVTTLSQVYYVSSIDDDNWKAVSFKSVGAVYRLENQHWMFYQKLSIGSSTVPFNSYNLYLKERGGQGMYVVRYDGLSESTILMLSYGISIGYKMTKYFRILLNASYLQPLQRFSMNETTTNLYTGEQVSPKTYHASTLGRRINISIGIGIPIYKRTKQIRGLNGKKSHNERIEELMEKKRKSFKWKSKKLL
jgi:hypothetical protein